MNSIPIFTYLNTVYLFEAPNGWRYPLVGGTRSRRFDGTSSKPHKLPENAHAAEQQSHQSGARCVSRILIGNTFGYRVFPLLNFKCLPYGSRIYGRKQAPYHGT